MLRHHAAIAGAACLLAATVAAVPAAHAATVAAVPAARAADAGPVDVLYAGSLVRLMTRGLAPAFARATGDTVAGLPGGSKGLALQIRDGLRTPDAFVSADPSVNALLEGRAGGDRVRWTVTFARSPLLIGFVPGGRFARALRTHDWLDALTEPGIRIGRTDPRLDPKGALTVRLVRRAAEAAGRPALARQVLGDDENPSQVFPEEDLVGRLESGQVDVGFFYSTEIADLGLASVSPGAALALGAVYTATVPADAPHAARGARFVAFLLGPEGEALMRARGLEVVRPAVGGDAAAVPAAVADAVAAWTDPGTRPPP